MRIQSFAVCPSSMVEDSKIFADSRIFFTLFVMKWRGWPSSLKIQLWINRVIFLRKTCFDQCGSSRSQPFAVLDSLAASMAPYFSASLFSTSLLLKLQDWSGKLALLMISLKAWVLNLIRRWIWSIWSGATVSTQSLKLIAFHPLCWNNCRRSEWELLESPF